MTDQDVSRMIAVLCRDLGYLTTRTAADPAPLRALTDAVRAGRADAAWLAEAVQLLRGLGIPLVLGERGWPFTSGGDAGLPGLGQGAASTTLFRCPEVVCERREPRRPGAARPHCPIYDADLPPEG